MKIGIDISQIVYQGTGVGRFTDGLVRAILQYDQQNQWIFFFSSLRQNLDPALEEKITIANHRLVKWKLPPTFLSFLFNDLHQFKIFNLNFKINPDWFITSDWTEPSLPIKKTTIVHDLTVFRYPDTVAKNVLQTQKKRLFWVKQESKIIFADSQTTRDDLIKYLKIDKQKIVVNYPGIKPLSKPTNYQIEKTLIKYQLNQPFILTVGKYEPRKNFPRLIEAFKKLNNDKINLAIVGPAGWDTDLVNYLTKSNLRNIKILGKIDDAELYSLYSKAQAVVFPSIWEGFGYPIVEAMSLATPVLCSNISTFKEIADDAALYFNPHDTASLTDCMNLMINNRQLRKKLIENGKIRGKQFTWRNYFDKLIKTLK